MAPGGGVTQDFEVNVEWGLDGLLARLDQTDVYVIVDVLSFSTCVDVALEQGAHIVPSREGPEAWELARELGAELATRRGRMGSYTLSPVSFYEIPAGSTVVLPSANGATLCLETADIPTFTACLRNSTAVAGAAVQIGRRVTVVAAGERWPNGSLRPALEDWIGAGAVVARMAANKSPEALAAEAAFTAARGRLVKTLMATPTGQELVYRGFEADVHCAAELDATRRAPILVDHMFLPVDP
jgi:2-phosphosulfolactate phosphatase